MNEPDTPSQYRLLKAARRTTRAEVTLVTVVTIITLWSFYALYKLSIGGTDSILGSNVLSRSRNSMIGHQELQSVNVEVNEAPNYSSQDGAVFRPGSPSIDPDVANNRKNSRIQQEVENRFREQLIRDILNKQRELYGDRLGPGSFGKIFWPNELDLRRPLPPMWLTRKNETRIAMPIDKSLVMMRQIVEPDLAYKQHASRPQSDYRLTTPRRSHGLPIRVDKSTVSKDVDRDVGESISIDRTTATTSRPAADNEAPIDQDPDGSADTENNADRDYPNNNQAEGDSDNMSRQQDEPASGDGDIEASKENTNEETGEDSSEKLSEDQKSEPIDEASLDRAKKASSSIDEEVDRMTQPSSDNILQHNDTNLDKRSLRDLIKGAVQFDDSLGASIVDSKHKKLPKPLEPGGLIAQFAAPSDEKSKKRKVVKHVQNIRPTKSPATVRKQRQERREDPKDLQIDHNHLTKIMSSASPGKVNRSHDMKSCNSRQSQVDSQVGSDDGPIDDPVQGRTMRRRNRRSLDLKQKSGLDPLPGITTTRPRNPKRPRSLQRRTYGNDFDNDDEDEGDNGKRRKPSIKMNDEKLEPKVTPKPEIDSIYENYTIPAASDISIQDLIAHKRLLDELDKSRLPPPHYWTGMHNSSDKIGSASVQPVASKPVIKGGDSSYDAIHSSEIETEQEDQTRKSGTKKGSKNSDSKAKSKLAESMKKGGFKSKKHNKEEQKYLKEKKFRGAKSGKKTAKGKGGKGGKKGTKYYKDKGFKKKGFKNIYVKNEFGQKKSYFDEFRDKDFKKKWKNFDDKYNYAQMKKWQSKDVKGAKKLKDEGEKFKDYDKSKYKKKFHSKQTSEASKKKKKYDEF